MKTRRTLAFWLALAVCAATVLGAMTWLTRGVLDAERARLTAQRDQAAAEARADLEERTRLALWRMDALGAGIVLRENLVTAEDYRSASPSAISTQPPVRLRFEMREDRNLNAVIPAGAVDQEKRLRALLASHPFPAAVAVDPVPKPRAMLRQAPAPQADGVSMINSIQRQEIPADQLRKDPIYQESSNVNERSQRAKVVGQTITPNQSKTADVARNEEQAPPGARSVGGMRLGTPQPAPAKPPAEVAKNEAKDRRAIPSPAIAPMAMIPAADSEKPPAPGTRGMPAADAGGISNVAPLREAPATKVEIVTIPAQEDVEMMRSAWIGGELFLLRKVTPRPAAILQQPIQAHLVSTTIQGVWLDSAVLTSNLLKEVADLLPHARLTPATDARTAADPLSLVSFPFTLERGETPLATAVPLTPVIGAPLWAAWGGVLCAFLTIAMLVLGVVRLSERRASFVSAVTHELRTPLTTFRLYSDMLAQDAVKPEKRGGYLRVLAREADRLSHLVENVLAFSRIERGNARSNLRETAVASLLESFRERFESRLASAGLSLTINTAPDLRLRADIAAVEHILFNLIDNAAKYAATADPPTVDLTASQAGRHVEIAVADHGPGIPAHEHRRVFRPFHKSAREAAETKPGVGLGLALSRRLARAQGGDLILTDSPTGCRFVLRLPAAPSSDATGK